MALPARVVTTLLPLLTQSTDNDKIVWVERNNYYQTRFLEWYVAIQRTGDIVSTIVRNRDGRFIGSEDLDHNNARALHDAVLAQTTNDEGEVSLTQLLSLQQLDRCFLPAVWQKVNVTASQSTGVAMDIVGTSLQQLPLARTGSLMSIGIVLTQALTNGLIRIELTRNGSDTGKTFDMTSSSGTKSIWEFSAGELVGQKGQELGIKWGSSPSMQPNNVIELNVFVEIQWIV